MGQGGHRPGPGVRGLPWSSLGLRSLWGILGRGPTHLGSGTGLPSPAPWVGPSLPHTALLSKRKPGPSLVLESYLQWLVFEIPFLHLLPPEAGSHFLSLIGAPGQGCFLSTGHPGPWQPGPHWLGASLPFQERSLPFPLQVASSFEHPRKSCLRSLRERQSLGGLNIQRV